MTGFTTIARFLVLTVAVTIPGLATGTEPEKEAKVTLDTATIEREIGKAGETQGDVYKISLPRTDLQVTVEGVLLKPGLALGSWIAFKPVGQGAVAHGDLVLAEDEVAPVVRELEEHGVRITALHNHLIHELPRVMFLHFWGQGEVGKLAQHLKQALSKTKTPIGEAKRGGPPTEEVGFDPEQIQATLGHKGTVKNGVLHVSVPRPETVTESGIELPPSMGTATAINVQGAGAGKVAATGDFVMSEDEVNHVALALVAHGIQVTALHNHLVHSSPNLFFMHFWANESAEKVSKGLRAGLDAMKKKGEKETS
jgi:urease accessory protein UreE